jgi:hypothetical protein
VKLHRIAIRIAVIVMLAPATALAQQPVRSFHHGPSSANAPLGPKGPLPSIAGKWDILSTDANGDPYNTSGGAYLGPIEFTVDLTLTAGSNLVQVNGHTFTSSACSADGTATVGGAIAIDGSGNGTVTFVATVDSGYTYTFPGKYEKTNPSQISGTWTTTAGACGVQSGQFTAYTYSPLTNNSYLGDFTSDVFGNQVRGVTVNLKEVNFAISGTISGPASSCFTGLTIDPTQSISSGGLAEFYATNASGGLVGFLGSNTDANFKQLPNDQPNETSLYITYVVYQGGGNCQAGDSGHDAVFRLRRPVPGRRNRYRIGTVDLER